MKRLQARTYVPYIETVNLPLSVLANGIALDLARQIAEEIRGIGVTTKVKEGDVAEVAMDVLVVSPEEFEREVVRRAQSLLASPRFAPANLVVDDYDDPRGV